MLRFLQTARPDSIAGGSASSLPDQGNALTGTPPTLPTEPAAAGSRPTRRGLSLERKLPLLIILLLVATLGTGLLFAYSMVARAAVANVTQRLEGIAEQLATIVAPTIPQGVASMGAVGVQDAVSDFLESGDSSLAPAAAETLSGLRPQSNPELPTVLLSADRTPLLWDGELPR